MYLQIFEELKTSERWRQYLEGMKHKSLKSLRDEKKTSFAHISQKLQNANFKVLKFEEVYKNVMVIENTWKVIFNNEDIRK